MTKSSPTLITNRYGKKTPTVIYESGVSISSPIYVQLTPGQNKAILNEVREIKRQQLMEMGFNQPRTVGEMSVQTTQTPPLSPIEEELGLTEDNLRYALFNRHGINERLFLQLQRLTGIQLVDRSQIENLHRQWLDHLFPETNERPKTKRTNKSSAPTQKKCPTGKSSTESEGTTTS